MDITEIAKAIDAMQSDDLLQVSGLLRARRAAIEEADFLEKLRAALSGMKLDYPTDQVAKVEFPTWEWDNGWFYQASGGTVTYTNGKTQDIDVNGRPADDALDDALDEISNQRRLGRNSVLRVNMQTGDLSHE